MKKFLGIMAFVCLAVYWDNVTNYFSGTTEAAYASDGVVLYATSWCQYCEKTRQFFREHDIPYIEYDIERSEQGLRQYEALGVRGVPVVNMYGTIIRGYSPDRMLAALPPGQ